MERLLNRKIPTFLKAINHMRSRYALCGFLLREIKLDPESEPLHHGLGRMKILLKNTGQGDHVPEAEHFVCTTKDSCLAGFAGTPFKNLPIALTIGLVLVAIFWNCSVAAEDEASWPISPKGIINGCSLNFHKNC